MVMACLRVDEPVPQLAQRLRYIRVVVCIGTEIEVQSLGVRISRCVCVRYVSLGRRAFATASISARSWINTNMSSDRPSTNTPQRLRESRTDIVGSPAASILASHTNMVARQSYQPSEPNDEERTDHTTLTTHRPSSAAPLGVGRRVIDSGQTFSNVADQAPSSGPNELLSEANRAVQRQPVDAITSGRHSTAGVQINNLTDGFDEYTEDAASDGDDGGEGDEGSEYVEGERAVQQECGGSAPLHDTNDYAQEDTLTDSDISSVASEDEYNVPDVIREAERDAESNQQQNLNAATPIQLDRRYKGFLRALCTETTTEAADQHTRNGLPYAIRVAKSLRLDQDMRDNEPFDKYAFALVVHVWQVVCLRLLHGVDQPGDPSEPLITYSGAYFLSAHSLVTARCAMAVSELRFAVKYWEDRLRQQAGNNPWLNDNWAKDVVQIDEDSNSYRNDTANRYLRALEDGLQGGLCDVLIDEETEDGDAEKTQLQTMVRLSEDSSKEARRQMLYMLLTMDPILLRAVIEGQLPRKSMIPSSQVSEILAKLNSGRSFQPGIYMNAICDRMGMSPTPAQWSKVCQLMLDYVQCGMAHNDVAEEIDHKIHPKLNWPRSLAHRGLRRYMEWRSYTEKGSSDLDRQNRQMVEFFVDQLRIRMLGQLAHTPLSVPVVELGFSNDPVRRLRQHRHHENSNYLMNLAKAVFEYQYPGIFTLQQHIIYNCWRPVQLWMGEILFTKLAQGYVTGGGGFSHEPAGRSNTSSFQVLSEKRWQELEYFVMASGDLGKRLQQNRDFTAQKGKEAQELHHARMRLLKAAKEAVEANVRLLDAQLQFPR